VAVGVLVPHDAVTRAPHPLVSVDTRGPCRPEDENNRLKSPQEPGSTPSPYNTCSMSTLFSFEDRQIQLKTMINTLSFLYLRFMRLNCECEYD